MNWKRIFLIIGLVLLVVVIGAAAFYHYGKRKTSESNAVNAPPPRTTQSVASKPVTSTVNSSAVTIPSGPNPSKPAMNTGSGSTPSFKASSLSYKKTNTTMLPKSSMTKVSL